MIAKASINALHALLNLLGLLDVNDLYFFLIYVLLHVFLCPILHLGGPQVPVVCNGGFEKGVNRPVRLKAAPPAPLLLT
jgi:hypothetical protein